MRFDPSKPLATSGLIGWFVTNPVASTLATLLLTLGGLLALSNMRSEVFPTIAPNTVVVSVIYPGANPAEVEEGITRRVEEAVFGLDGVESVRSTATENRGYITVELADFADRQKLKDDIETAVDGLSSFPPENAEKPKVTASDPISGVTTLVVTGGIGGGIGEYQLRQAAEQLERDLLTQPKISLVSLSGDRDYEISIEVSEDKLRQYNLSFNEVAAAVRSASIDLSGGEILSRAGNILLRVNEKRQTGAAFDDIIIRANPDGSLITVKDVAHVIDGFSPLEVYNTYNGRPAIFVDVKKAVAEDVLKVRQAVTEFLADYTPPQGVEVLEFRDQSKILNERMNLLTRNALFGFALVFTFLVLMLDLKLAFWVCVGITTAFLGGFILLAATGVTMTMISMFALIIVLGLVVDDAVVIGENIETMRERGMDDISATLAGVKGVFAPVMVGVFTTIAAFSPLLFTGGTFGDIARAIPIVVISVLLVSLFEAFFILPSHLSHHGSWSKGIMADIQKKISGALNRFIQNVIKPAVRITATYRYVTLTVAVCFFILTIMLVRGGEVKFVFFPTIEGNDISVSVDMAKGAPIERTKQVVDQIEAALYRTAERAKAERGEDILSSVAITVGGQASIGGGPGQQSSFSSASHSGQLRVELMPFGARQMTALAVERMWREELGEVLGVDKLRFTSTVGSSGQDVNFELYHEDKTKLSAAVERLKEDVRTIKGAYEVEDNFDIGKKELIFKVNPVGKAAGLTNRSLALQVRQAFLGEEVQRIQRGREEIKAYVRYPESARRTAESLDKFRVRLPDGSESPLATVANWTTGRAYSSITRVDGQQIISVSARIDRSLNTPAEANDLLLNDILPALQKDFPRLRYSQAGAAKDQGEDFASLIAGFQFVLLLIYAILAVQLRSYIQPAAIMVSIPLGIAGAILGHFVLGFPLSFVSIFGMVALAGVAVNSSVVLVDYYNNVRAEGADALDAATQAATRRFRPVMLTTLTTALGLGPLLFETSPQAQFLIPMAVSLGFGIVISGIMVTFVTPALCLVIEDMRGGHKKDDS